MAFRLWGAEELIEDQTVTNTAFKVFNFFEICVICVICGWYFFLSDLQIGKTKTVFCDLKFLVFRHPY